MRVHKIKFSIRPTPTYKVIDFLYVNKEDRRCRYRIIIDSDCPFETKQIIDVFNDISFFLSKKHKQDVKKMLKLLKNQDDQDDELSRV